MNRRFLLAIALSSGLWAMPVQAAPDSNTDPEPRPSSVLGGGRGQNAGPGNSDEGFLGQIPGWLETARRVVAMYRSLEKADGPLGYVDALVNGSISLANSPVVNDVLDVDGVEEVVGALEGVRTLSQGLNDGYKGIEDAVESGDSSAVIEAVNESLSTLDAAKSQLEGEGAGSLAANATTDPSKGVSDLGEAIRRTEFLQQDANTLRATGINAASRVETNKVIGSTAPLDTRDNTVEYADNYVVPRSRTAVSSRAVLQVMTEAMATQLVLTSQGTAEIAERLNRVAAEQTVTNTHLKTIVAQAGEEVKKEAGKKEAELQLQLGMAKALINQSCNQAKQLRQWYQPPASPSAPARPIPLLDCE